MKYCLLFIFLSISFFAQSQTWQPLDYNPDKAGIEENPLKGFVDLFNVENEFPRSINAKLFRMDSLMNNLNDFNWSQIDTFLAHSAEEGNTAYLQVNIDPGDGITYMPSFLDGLVEFEDYTGGAVDDLCPDWNNPYLMEAMLNFIEAFGERYNDDPRIFMVHLGLYGIYGEWHIGDVENIRPEFAMTPENKILLADAYKLAFPDKILLARYPENMPNPQDFGYSDGLFFTQSISNSSYNNGYFHYTMRAYNADKNWKNIPIGGEIDPCIQDTLWKAWPNITQTLCGDPPNTTMTNIQDVEESLDSIHPTWLFSHHIFSNIGDETTEEWQNAIRVQKLIGYTLYANEYRLTAANQKPSIEVNIRNTGLAPMYANWDIEFGALNQADEFKLLGRKKWNLQLIQPDELDNYRAFNSDTSLIDGTYEIMMRVVNPLDTISANAKKVRFANKNQDTSMIGWLTLGDMNIVSGSTGITPISVNGISISQSSASLIVGDNLSLTATISPGNATNQNITWTSDQPRTASVNSSGFVTTGPAYGDAILSAYSQDGNLVASCNVHVEPLRVEIPAVIESEDFNRMMGVVIQNGGTAQHLGFIDDRDWMDYSVIVTETAVFTVDYIYSNKYQDSEISLIDTAGNVLAITTLPQSGEWFEWDTVTSDEIVLPVGEYNLRIESSIGGFNVDWMDFKSDSPLLSSYTFIGTTDNKFLDDTNWMEGKHPPNGYNGLITIAADCTIPKDRSFLLRSAGEIIVNPTINFSIE